MILSWGFLEDLNTACYRSLLLEAHLHWMVRFLEDHQPSLKLHCVPLICVWIGSTLAMMIRGAFLETSSPWTPLSPPCELLMEMPLLMLMGNGCSGLIEGCIESQSPRCLDYSGSTVLCEGLILSVELNLLPKGIVEKLNFWGVQIGVRIVHYTMCIRSTHWNRHVDKKDSGVEKGCIDNVNLTFIRSMRAEIGYLY